MPEAVIVDALRTPIGRAFRGSMAGLRPDDVLAELVDRLLDRSPALDPAAVDEVCCGCALPEGMQAHNLGRIVVLLSGRLGPQTAGLTISRYCASSLDAIRHAVNAIRAGDGEVRIAAGVEWLSAVRGPGAVARAADRRNPRLAGPGGGAYAEMGATAVNVALRNGVGRSEMDNFAQRSQALAVAARESGFFDDEVMPVTVPGHGGPIVLRRDECPRPESSLAALAALPETFEGGAGITAGNCCPLADGAAAVLIMSDRRADQLGLRPRARIVSSATAGIEPEYMGLAPIPAIQRALSAAGMTIADIEVAEINEAFAAQVLPVAAATGIPLERLNRRGGAIALGHPYGMTGARIMGTLIRIMEADDHQVGLEAMCVAGGQGEAVIVERLS